MRNTRRGFRPIHHLKLREGRTSEWLDVDNDGDLDAFVVQGAPKTEDRDSVTNAADFLLLNKRGRLVKNSDREIRGPRDGNGDAVSVGDYDRDGRVDLHVTNGYGGPGWPGRAQLIANRSSGGNWLALELHGDPKNPFGMGARVRVRSGERTIWREVTDGFHHRVQSEVGYVHLGLGCRLTASVRIQWPDGTIDCLRSDAGVVALVMKGTLPCG